ncbi:MAG: TolC family protein [Candidatus Riflebacteria bacterium]|nr:TolC family protein [Candidatus Riflebacteria bacterium]
MIRSTILLLLMLTPVLAGSGRKLSLHEAMTLALARNQDIAIERESLRIATTSIRKADGSYDPTLRFDTRVRDYTLPVNSLLSGAPADQVAPSQTTFTGSTGLSRLMKGGGTLSLSLNAARDWTNNFFTLMVPAYSSSIGLDFRQPLLQNRKIDPARRAIRIARAERDRSMGSFRRVVQETVAAVEAAYWTLAAARYGVEIRRKSVVWAEDQLNDTRSRVAAGVLSASDTAAPEAEVERRRGELFAAEEAVQRAQNQLKTLLLDDTGDPAWDEELLPIDPPEIVPSTQNVAAAIKEAHARRPELDDAAARLVKSQVEVAAAKDRVRPQLDLVASYVRRGLSGAQNPTARVPFGPPGPVPVHEALEGDFGRSVGTIGENLYPDATIGVACSVPLGNKAARADRDTAVSSLRQMSTTIAQLKQRIGAEVRNAACALTTAQQRIQVARAGLTAARSQLKAEEDRFQAGITSNFFVLTRQNDLAQAQITLVNALADYWKAKTEFARARGVLLDERRVQIVEDLAIAEGARPAR